jgi:DNA repair exonuclease SbcCD ATPase subunit
VNDEQAVMRWYAREIAREIARLTAELARLRQTLDDAEVEAAEEIARLTAERDAACKQAEIQAESLRVAHAEVEHLNREVERLTFERDEQADRAVAAVRELAMALAEIDARPTYAEIQEWRDEFGIVRRNTSGAPDRYDNLPAYVARLRRAKAPEVQP